MFKDLKEYDKIFVGGIQRSGTRICAKMISHDTGLRYLDERDYGRTVQDVDGFIETSEKGRFVMHCPAMTAHLRFVLEYFNDDILVVLMKRDYRQIKNSMQRIDWGWHETEKMKWLSYMPYIEDKDLIEMYLDFLEKYKLMLENIGLEVMIQEYEELSEHELWVDKEKRINFSPEQTTL